jgi:gamma-glutamylcyclotransferase (GGCT)/AIG2-like uncharacterized protein YtfP
MEHLFAYGTLMCEDIMREIGGYVTPSMPALLNGFRRCSVKNESYPGIIPDANGSVEGLVYRNVPESSWKRLDAFEGGKFALQGRFANRPNGRVTSVNQGQRRLTSIQPEGLSI